VDSGIYRAVIDLHELKRFDMTIIKLLFSTMQVFRELALHYVLVGNPQIVSECKGFEDTKGWQFVDSLEEAKAHLVKTSPALAATT
jgi:two-component system cell cycle response regulator